MAAAVGSHLDVCGRGPRRTVLVVNNNPDGFPGKFTPLFIGHCKAAGLEVLEAQSVEAVHEIEAVVDGGEFEVVLIVTCGSSVVLTEPLDISLHVTKTTTAMLQFPDVPVVGICYGMQLISLLYGGSLDPRPETVRGPSGERGAFCPLRRTVAPSRLLASVGGSFVQWCSNFIFMGNMPRGFVATAVDEHERVFAFEHVKEHVYGVLFHPEMFGNEVRRDVLDAILDLANVRCRNRQVFENV